MEPDTGPGTVLRFISLFAPASDIFLDGLCYWFSHILSARFGGVTMYEQEDGHFLQKIGSRLYDASGDVTEKYAASKYLAPLDEIMVRDPTLYRRLVRDCVNKEKGSD